MAVALLAVEVFVSRLLPSLANESTNSPREAVKTQFTSRMLTFCSAISRSLWKLTFPKGTESRQNPILELSSPSNHVFVEPIDDDATHRNADFALKEAAILEKNLEQDVIQTRLRSLNEWRHLFEISKSCPLCSNAYCQTVWLGCGHWLCLRCFLKKYPATVDMKKKCCPFCQKPLQLFLSLHEMEHLMDMHVAKILEEKQIARDGAQDLD